MEAAEVLDRMLSSYSAVLQSKRLLLQSVLRRLANRPSAELQGRAARLEADIARVDAVRARLRLGRADVHDPGFWIDAYGLLIRRGEDLAGELRRHEPALPGPEAENAEVDLRLIDDQLILWRRRLREWMTQAAAGA